MTPASLLPGYSPGVLGSGTRQLESISVLMCFGLINMDWIKQRGLGFSIRKTSF